MDNQAPPQLPPPAPPAPSAKNDPLAVTSLVLGAVSVFFSACCFPISLALGPLAIVFGIVALVRISSSHQQGKGLAIAGIVTGALGPAIGLILFFVGLASSTITEVLGGRGS